MRIIIAGGRDFTDYAKAKWNLDIIFQNLNKSEVVIISGTARGGDAMGERYAAENGYPVERFKPDWGRLGKAAGMVRNRQMAVDGKADALVAFDTGGPGTTGMISIARELGLQVRVIDCRK